MADVFISYKKEEQALVERLETALNERQLTVWWDQSLGGGDRWDETIKIELAAADAVIVIWSEKSATSEYVNLEAKLAMDAAKLLPVCFERNPPVPTQFRDIQVEDLTGWNGDTSDPRFRKVVQGVRTIRQRRVNKAASKIAGGARKAQEKNSLLSVILLSDLSDLKYHRLFLGAVGFASFLAFVQLAALMLTGAPYIVQSFAMFFVALLAGLILRALHQSVLMASDRPRGHFFESSFSTYIVVCAIVAPALTALNLSTDDLSLSSVLRFFPVAFIGCLTVVVLVRAIWVALSYLLRRVL